MTGHWHERVGRAVEHSGFGVLLLDREGRVLHANAPARSLLGPRRIGRAFAEIVHPDDRGWCETQIALLLGGAIDQFRNEVRLDEEHDHDAWAELVVRASRDGTEAGAVAMIEDARDRAQRERELRRLADTDPLTDVLNRRRFSSELERHLAQCARYGPQGSLLLVDLDGLKQINDRDGHLAGDRAIIATARILRAKLRASDVLARLGGDEFAVLLPFATAEHAEVVAEAILHAARSAEVPERVAVSIGLAAIGAESDPDALIARADRALYAAKHAGGDGYRLASPAPAEPPEDVAARVEALDAHRSLDSSAEAITLDELLGVVAELGEASVSLIAWERGIPERLITPAWSEALDHELIELHRFEEADREWLHTLTSAGVARVRALGLRDDEEGLDARI